MGQTLDIEWQLQDAKNRFSQVVRSARQGVPQWVTVHGTRAVVVISADEYRQLKQASVGVATVEPAQKSVLEMLRGDLPEGGLSDEEVDALFARPRGPGRRHEVEL